VPKRVPVACREGSTYRSETDRLARRWAGHRWVARPRSRMTVACHSDLAGGRWQVLPCILSDSVMPAVRCQFGLVTTAAPLVR